MYSYIQAYKWSIQGQHATMYHTLYKHTEHNRAFTDKNIRTIFLCLESDHCTERSHPNWCWCSNNTEVSCEGLKCGHSQRCCCRSELKHFSTISYCDIDGIENDDAILVCHWRWVPCYTGWARAASYSYKILWVWCWYCRRNRDLQTLLIDKIVMTCVIRHYI